jgi:AraC-like DNA-binding protein
MPLREVAEALAYADISPFYRAFQRWTGQTPAAWRRQQDDGQALQHKADPTA